jgi:hypothetical protein
MSDDDPRVVTQTLFAYQTQPSSADTRRLPRFALSRDSSDDPQGNILCAQLGSFHFNTAPLNGGEHGGLGEQVNAPTAITESSYVLLTLE